MTWPMDSHAGRCAPVRGTSVSVWTMPPPEPPSVNAGRMIAGRPISASAARARSCRFGGRRTFDHHRRRIGRPISLQQPAEALAILRHLDRLEGRAQQPCSCAVRARLRARAATHRFSAVWPPRPDRMPSGCSRSRMRSTDRDGERLEVDDVGHARVGHDRGRVAVEQDRPDPFRRGARGRPACRRSRTPPPGR